jgi:hypothetical protein
VMLNGLGDHGVIVRRVASKPTSQRQWLMMTLRNYSGLADTRIRGPVRGPSGAVSATALPAWRAGMAGSAGSRCLLCATVTGRADANWNHSA